LHTSNIITSRCWVARGRCVHRNTATISRSGNTPLVNIRADNACDWRGSQSSVLSSPSGYQTGRRVKIRSISL